MPCDAQYYNMPFTWLLVCSCIVCHMFQDMFMLCEPGWNVPCLNRLQTSDSDPLFRLHMKVIFTDCFTT